VGNHPLEITMMGMKCSKGDRTMSFDTQNNVISIDKAEKMSVHSTIHQFLSPYEREEILQYSPIYYAGENCMSKIQAIPGTEKNCGYDDSNARYITRSKDHIMYRYELITDLGKGAFGDVYKALDHATGEIVALKIIRNERRFHRQAKIEVKVLETLREQDVDGTNACVHMRDYFVFRDHLCITFEMHGNDLYTQLKLGKFAGFSQDHVKGIAFDTLKCLDVLYNNRIVHADLKPENMLMKSRNSEEVKIIDFGSSCFAHEKVHTYIQSRYYRSPEIMLGLGYGTPIDMWSLGCIMVELTTGTPIFPAKDEHELMVLQTEIFGVPPESLLRRAHRTDEFFSYDRNQNTYTPRHYLDRKGKRRLPNGKTLEEACQVKDPLFIDFVRRCLAVDPAKRMTPSEALQHDYITTLVYPPCYRNGLKRSWSENGLVAKIISKNSLTNSSKYSGSEKSLNDSGISISPKEISPHAMGFC